MTQTFQRKEGSPVPVPGVQPKPESPILYTLQPPRAEAGTPGCEPAVGDPGPDRHRDCHFGSSALCLFPSRPGPCPVLKPSQSPVPCRSRGWHPGYDTAGVAGKGSAQGRRRWESRSRASGGHFLEPTAVHTGKARLGRFPWKHTRVGGVATTTLSPHPLPRPGLGGQSGFCPYAQKQTNKKQHNENEDPGFMVPSHPATPTGPGGPLLRAEWPNQGSECPFPARARPTCLPPHLPVPRSPL